MFHLSKVIWWFVIGFLFTFIVSLGLLSSYVGIEIDSQVILWYGIISLLVGLIFAGSAKGKTHFGHFPFLLGLLIASWAGLALFGNLELTSLKKPLWWVIEDKSISRNLAIIWFIGVSMLVVGAKWIGGNLFFLRPFGKR